MEKLNNHGAILLVLLLILSRSEASVLYDGFGPNNTFNTSSFASVGKGTYNGSSIDVDQAFAFKTPTGPKLNLTGIDLGVRRYFGPNTLDVLVTAHNPNYPFDSDGAPDLNTVLFAQRIDNFASGYQALSINPNLQLEANTWYWLVLSMPESQPNWLIGWHGGMNPFLLKPGDPFMISERYTGSAVPNSPNHWETSTMVGAFSSALRITVNEVTAPPTVFSIILGLVLIRAVGRVRRVSTKHHTARGLHAP
jgi:hypothetical protein